MHQKRMYIKNSIYLIWTLLTFMNYQTNQFMIKIDFYGQKIINQKLKKSLCTFQRMSSKGEQKYIKILSNVLKPHPKFQERKEG